MIETLCSTAFNSTLDNFGTFSDLRFRFSFLRNGMKVFRWEGYNNIDLKLLVMQSSMSNDVTNISSTIARCTSLNAFTLQCVIECIHAKQTAVWQVTFVMLHFCGKSFRIHSVHHEAILKMVLPRFASKQAACNRTLNFEQYASARYHS